MVYCLQEKQLGFGLSYCWLLSTVQMFLYYLTAVFSESIEKLHGGADDIEVSIYIYHTVYKFDNFMVGTGIDGSLFFHVILTPWKSMKGDVVFCLVGCKAYLQLFYFTFVP